MTHKIIHQILALASLATSSSIASQQGSPGLRLVAPSGLSDTFLIDANGNTVHTWPSTLPPGLSFYLDPNDGQLVRTIRTPGTNIAGGIGGGVQKLALDGSVLWDFRYDSGGNRSHHDIAIMPNGNVLMIAWEDVSNEDITSLGRDPFITDSTTPFRPDHIIEVEPVGPTSSNIVWEWHAIDHVIQDVDPSACTFGVVGNHPELIDINFPRNTPSNGDWIHMNAIAYNPINDWILMSARAQNEIWVIDHGTTTQEAAGHTGGRRGRGGDLLYRWGNPRAYRAGGIADQQLFGQHNVNVIPPGVPGAGNFTLFNNNAGTLNNSQAFEIAPPLDPSGNFIIGPNGRYGPPGPAWSYTSAHRSGTQSSAERMPNGNTLLNYATQRLLEEVTAAGQVVWSHQLPFISFHAHYVERSLWADVQEISIATGGAIQFSSITGSNAQGDTYLLLGSASGTSPGIQLGLFNIPLNADDYFRSTLTFPSALPLGNSTGVLDRNGRAQASFSLPAGLLPPQAIGIRLDHAVVTLNRSGAITHTSNAMPLVLTR